MTTCERHFLSSDLFILFVVLPENIFETSDFFFHILKIIPTIVISHQIFIFD